MSTVPLEVPNELGHIRQYLLTTYKDMLPPGRDEANFLTRALAAWTVQHLTGCPLADAVAAVVDGGGDGGIDAVYYSANSNELWVIQTKFHQNGRGEPALGDITKFKAGIDNLLQGRFEAFDDNAGWQTHLPQLRHLLTFGGPQVSSVGLQAFIPYRPTGINCSMRCASYTGLIICAGKLQPDYAIWLADRGRRSTWYSRN